MDTLQEVLTKWENDLKFKEDFKKDPELALQAAKIELSHDDLKKVKALLKLREQKAFNIKLDDKINK